MLLQSHQLVNFEPVLPVPVFSFPCVYQIAYGRQSVLARPPRCSSAAAGVDVLLTSSLPLRRPFCGYKPYLACAIAHGLMDMKCRHAAPHDFISQTCSASLCQKWHLGSFDSLSNAQALGLLKRNSMHGWGPSSRSGNQEPRVIIHAIASQPESPLRVPSANCVSADRPKYGNLRQHPKRSILVPFLAAENGAGMAHGGYRGLSAVREIMRTILRREASSSTNTRWWGATCPRRPSRSPPSTA